MNSMLYKNELNHKIKKRRKEMNYAHIAGCRTHKTLHLKVNLLKTTTW